MFTCPTVIDLTEKNIPVLPALRKPLSNKTEKSGGGPAGNHQDTLQDIRKDIKILSRFHSHWLRFLPPRRTRHPYLFIKIYFHKKIHCGPDLVSGISGRNGNISKTTGEAERTRRSVVLSAAQHAGKKGHIKNGPCAVGTRRPSERGFLRAPSTGDIGTVKR